MPVIPLNLVVTPFAERGQAEPSAWAGTDPTDALRVARYHLAPCQHSVSPETRRRFRHPARSSKRLAYS